MQSEWNLVISRTGSELNPLFTNLERFPKRALIQFCIIRKVDRRCSIEHTGQFVDTSILIREKPLVRPLE